MLKTKRIKMRLWMLLGIGALVLAACGPIGGEPAVSNVEEVAVGVESDDATAVPQPTNTPEEETETQEQDSAEEAVSPSEEKEIVTEDDRPQQLQLATSGWNTDWTRHTIAYSELLSGGPPRDGIPSIDEPIFIDQEEASTWLADNEPVIALEINDDVRAYPIQVLTWHEIANDVVGDVPVVVTFCPLCNSAIVFDRRLDGEVYEFGTSGLLRNSDLVMYDRTTESLWQQFTGEGIVGGLTGKQLTFLASSLVSFADFKEAFPEGRVLSRETGLDRPYGQNPYAGYDTYDNPLSANGDLVLFQGEQDGRLEAAERVVTISLADAGVDVAYPLTILAEVGVINDQQGGQDLVVFHTSGTSSALGAATISEGDDVGATGVFDPNLNGQKLTFSKEGDKIVDAETGSTWNILGQAIEGSLAGQSLEPIVHCDHFWFSWAAFKPDTIIYSS